MSDIKQLTDFLVEFGTADVPHTEKTYLGHLIAVHRDLASWGCDEAVCEGGMFHSIYGTEMFQGFKWPLDRRNEIRELIGPRAERLAYLNCAMDRASFDANHDRQGDFWLVDRLNGERVELEDAVYFDLCRVHLCDWLEQVPRCKMWDYRREAFRRMAERLGGAAQEAYDRVFAGEAAAGSCRPGA